MMQKGPAPDISAFEAEEVFRRDFVDLAFSRLRLNRPISPDQVESAMRLIDSGVMDGFIERVVPPEQPHSTVGMYVNVKPFSYAEWKKRHGVE